MTFIDADNALALAGDAAAYLLRCVSPEWAEHNAIRDVCLQNRCSLGSADAGSAWEPCCTARSGPHLGVRLCMLQLAPQVRLYSCGGALQSTQLLLCSLRVPQRHGNLLQKHLLCEGRLIACMYKSKQLPHSEIRPFAVCACLQRPARLRLFIANAGWAARWMWRRCSGKAPEWGFSYLGLGLLQCRNALLRSEQGRLQALHLLARALQLALVLSLGALGSPQLPLQRGLLIVAGLCSSAGAPLSFLDLQR